MAQFDSVDLSSVTGWELKCQLAEAMGFPTVSLSLVSADGRQLGDRRVLQDTLAESASKAEPISISCVLGAQRAVGPKNERKRPAMSKAGTILSKRLRSGSLGKVRRSRVPNPALRKAAESLLCDSFAPELKELIRVGVEAACQQTSEHAATAARGQHVFRNAAHGVCVDLSSCRLWMASVEKKDSLSRALLKDGLISAVLWRLLHGWPGSPESPVRPGPVLEVLFLATNPECRESGEAKKLVADLEKVAADLGCAAVAVAAVPVQGRKFWKGCGFKVAVPLAKEDSDDAEPGLGAGLGEPVSALGEFLRDHMLLFNDTPLVAKALKRH